MNRGGSWTSDNEFRVLVRILVREMDESKVLTNKSVCLTPQNAELDSHIKSDTNSRNSKVVVDEVTCDVFWIQET